MQKGMQKKCNQSAHSFHFSVFSLLLHLGITPSRKLYEKITDCKAKTWWPVEEDHFKAAPYQLSTWFLENDAPNRAGANMHQMDMNI